MLVVIKSLHSPMHGEIRHAPVLLEEEKCIIFIIQAIKIERENLLYVLI